MQGVSLELASQWKMILKGRETVDWKYIFRRISLSSIEYSKYSIIEVLFLRD